jgi:hypothetical protein
MTVLCAALDLKRRGTLERCRRPRSRPLLRLGTSFGDELRGILCRVSSLSMSSRSRFSLSSRSSSSSRRRSSTLFADLSVVLFLFFESLRGLFFALDVEFDQGSVFGTVCLYSGFRLSNVDVVYQVESYWVWFSGRSMGLVGKVTH